MEGKPLSTTIISSLISAFAALAVCLINNHFTRAETQKKHEQTVELITYRLDQLEKKVDKHNQVIERTYELEKRADVLEEKVKVANNRIKDLEQKGA